MLFISSFVVVIYFLALQKSSFARSCFFPTSFLFLLLNFLCSENLKINTKTQTNLQLEGKGKTVSFLLLQLLNSLNVFHAIHTFM